MDWQALSETTERIARTQKALMQAQQATAEALAVYRQAKRREKIAREKRDMVLTQLVSRQPFLPFREPAGEPTTVGR